MDALSYLPFATRGLVRRGPPLHLTLFVTGRCNARCRHCFHWREVAAGVEGPSLEQVRALADSAARLGPLLWVSFGGGEPLLRRDLPELARAFGRHGLRHLAIPTNGLVEERQHEAVARILAESPDLHLAVGVSIDGPADAHDALRQVPGGHARALASFRALRRQREALPSDQARRLGLGLLVAVTADNQELLAAYLEELVDELRPDNVTVNLARGDALEREQLAVDPDRYAQVVASKRRLMETGRLPYFDFPLARLAVARDRQMYAQVERLARGDRSRHLPCTAGTLSAVVFEDGSVHPCEVLGRSLGNLNDCGWDLGRLWSTAAAARLRGEIEATRCACTWECAVADNVLFSPRRWPALALEALRS